MVLLFIDQLITRLKELNTVFFGDAFKPENGVKGQLWEYKKAKFRYLDGLRTDLAVYFKLNVWEIPPDNIGVGKDGDIYCSATNGGLHISYSAEQNGDMKGTTLSLLQTMV